MYFLNVIPGWCKLSLLSQHEYDGITLSGSWFVYLGQYCLLNFQVIFPLERALHFFFRKFISLPWKFPQEIMLQECWKSVDWENVHSLFVLSFFEEVKKLLSPAYVICVFYVEINSAESFSFICMWNFFYHRFNLP